MVREASGGREERAHAKLTRGLTRNGFIIAAKIDWLALRTATRRGRLLEGQALRDGRHQPVLGHDQALGLGPEGGPTEPEHPVADLAGRDPVADRLDLTGELGAEDRPPRSPEPRNSR